MITNRSTILAHTIGVSGLGTYTLRLPLWFSLVSWHLDPCEGVLEVKGGLMDIRPTIHSHKFESWLESQLETDDGQTVASEASTWKHMANAIR